MEPVKVVLFSNLALIELMLSVTMLPSSVSPFAVKVTNPPFDPL